MNGGRSRSSFAHDQHVDDNCEKSNEEEQMMAAINQTEALRAGLRS
jgi:hypothetical protein